MPSSGYTAISFTAGEQPATAKWNLVGSNDASFNTGNGFNDGVIMYRHLSTTDIPTNQQAWVAPTLTNGTVTTTVGYMKDSLGFVHLRGQINLGGNLAMFTLPAGYLPGQYKELSISSVGAFAVISISTAGVVSRIAGTGAGNTDLDGVIFQAGG